MPQPDEEDGEHGFAIAPSTEGDGEGTTDRGQL